MDLSQLTGDDNSGVLLFDFSQIAISTITSTYTPQDEINENIVRHVILNSIKFNVLKYKALYPNIVIAIDNATNGYWRRQKYYYYKKSREEKRTKDEWDWVKIFDCIKIVADEFKSNMPYKVINLDQIEADDIIGVLCKYISNIDATTPIMIISSDGDFTQLHKFKNVKQYSPMHKKLVQPKHGSYYKDLMTKIVKGDPKDCIANIYMPSDFLYVKLDGERQKSVSSKLMASVFEAKDPSSLFDGDQLKRYIENKNLIDFDMIPDNISQRIINEFNNIKPAPRRMVYPYFVKKGLSKLLDSANNF